MLFYFRRRDERRKKELLLEIDQKLTEMPADRQNMAAAFALGIREGIRIVERKQSCQSWKEPYADPREGDMEKPPIANNKP